MKKNATTTRNRARKTLKLSKVSLRKLSSDDLQHVAGGSNTQSLCVTDCC